MSRALVHKGLCVKSGHLTKLEALIKWFHSRSSQCHHCLWEHCRWAPHMGLEQLLFQRTACVVWNSPFPRVSSLSLVAWSHLQPMQYPAFRNACACLGGLQWTIHRVSQVWIPHSVWISKLHICPHGTIHSDSTTDLKELHKPPPSPVHSVGIQVD